MAMGRFEKSLPSVYQHFLSCFSLLADPAFAMVNMTHTGLATFVAHPDRLQQSIEVQWSRSENWTFI